MSKPKTCVESSASALKAAIAREARRVTSYDVALVAGVSQSAVSRCFQPGASVSEATLARVRKAAALLDYIPNAAARSLITRRSNMVAVIITAAASQHYPQLLPELSQQIGARGKRVLLFMLNHEAEAARVLAEVWQYQVDGVIAAADLEAEHLAEFARRRLPLVLFNRSAAGVHTVICDHREAGRLLVSRLAAAGHRRFAFIAGTDDSRVARERRHGACARLAELGLPAPEVTVGQSGHRDGGAGLRAVLEHLGALPDAVLCSSDALAVGCLDFARHALRLEVPRDLSVAALDAVEPPNWLAYQLTTVRQPITRMAMAAAELLCGVIDRPGQALHQAGLNGATDSPAMHQGPGASAERRVFSAQLVEGATARLPPAALAPFAATPGSGAVLRPVAQDLVRVGTAPAWPGAEAGASLALQL